MVEKIPNLRHLYAVSEIGRCGSISRTAIRVHLSQSAVTQAVSRLEAQVGERLFERTGTGMHPTVAGESFIERIDRAFRHLQMIDAEIGGPRASDSDAFSCRMTSTQLRTLIAVVESGGFSLAARRLGITQPSVHRAARDLEKMCQRQLFHSTGSGVGATALAQHIARCASLAFAEIHQGFEEVDEVHGRMQSRVGVGALPLARTQLIPEAASILLDKYPDARISIIDGPYDELLRSLLHGRIDVIIGALRRPPPSEHIVQESLFEDPLSVMVRTGHPLLGTRAPAANVLAKLQWVVPRSRTPARRQFDDFFSQRKVPLPTSIIECSSLVATRGLLMQSDRAALLSVRQASVEVQSGYLTPLLESLPGTARIIGMSFRTDWKPTTVQKCFMDTVRRIGTAWRLEEV